MSEFAIETHLLRKEYGRLAAVEGLDLRVPRGSVYGFLGRNGAGKTTTIRMLAGLVHPTSGTMQVLDLDPKTDRRAVLERTGFVIDKLLPPTMTGNDLVRFNRGFFPRWSDALARKYAEALEIPMNRGFRKLSTGNQTKLSLLLALAQGAELLVLDEPIAGLDPVVTDQLLRLLRDDFASEGRTLFLSSHQLSEMERVMDRVGILDGGRLLLQARLKDLRANFRRVRVAGEMLPVVAGGEIFRARVDEGTTEYVVGAKGEEFAAALRSQGARVLDVTPMTLAEIFLEVVAKGAAHVPVEVLA